MPAAAPTPSFADLPEAVLAYILEHVPLQQRLSRCALVCRSWAAAATAVPAHVDVELVSQDKCQQLSAWLEACGQQVVSLTAAGKGDTSLQLQCHKLRRLRSLQLSELWCPFAQLQGGPVTRSCSRAAAQESSSTAAGGGAANAVVLLPRLRALRLNGCSVSRHELLQLSALSRLSQLHLAGIQLCHSKTEQPVTDKQQAAAVRELLQHFTGLSDLEVCFYSSIAQLVGPISTMQRLQRLELLVGSSCNARLLAALPVSLTALVVTGSDRPTITAAAQLSRLTNLQCLSTTLISNHPAVLAGLTWLRHLCLSWPYSPAQAPTNAPALLAALGRLTQLQHLELDKCRLGAVQQQHQQQPQQQQLQLQLGQQEEAFSDGYQCFSDLTASTQLTALRLIQPFSKVLPGPAALDHMFPAGRVLPHLAVLHLDAHRRGQVFSAAYQEPAPRTCVGAEQVARIAASCPALRRLVLREVTHPDFDTACLDQLPPGVTSVEGLDHWRPAV